MFQHDIDCIVQRGQTGINEERSFSQNRSTVSPWIVAASFSRSVGYCAISNPCGFYRDQPQTLPIPFKLSLWLVLYSYSSVCLVSIGLLYKFSELECIWKISLLYMMFTHFVFCEIRTVGFLFFSFFHHRASVSRKRGIRHIDSYNVHVDKIGTMNAVEIFILLQKHCHNNSNT